MTTSALTVSFNAPINFTSKLFTLGFNGKKNKDDFKEAFNTLLSLAPTLTISLIRFSLREFVSLYMHTTECGISLTKANTVEMGISFQPLKVKKS